jgi:hypothetical protein
MSGVPRALAVQVFAITVVFVSCGAATAPQLAPTPSQLVPAASAISSSAVDAGAADYSALTAVMGHIRPEAIRAHMAFLADDALEGRGTGTRGFEIAAKYVAAQFAEAGLEPAGSSGSYMQSVPMRKIEIVADMTTLSIVGVGKERRLKFGEDFVLFGDPTRPDTAVDAPAVFAGFGVTAPELGYDDYRTVDAKGKIVAPKTLEETFAAAKDSAPNSFPLSVSIRMRTVTRHSSVSSPNVIAELRGSDARLRGERVVLTAHLDHLGIGAAVAGDTIYNGALDNASGVAAMLAVARGLSELPAAPKRSVLFVATTGEESGFIGADYFTHHPTVPRADVVADLNIDGAMGMLYDFKDVVAYGSEHSSLGPLVEQVVRRAGLEVSPDPMPEEATFVRVDSFPFVKAGIPSVFVTEGFKTVDPSLDGRAIVMKFEATRYHTPQDDMKQPLHFASAVKGVRVDLAIAWAIAQEPARPEWNHPDFFGDKFGGG